MQTFLPYPTFRLSAQSLDNKRLNKQITETYQILKTIFRPKFSSSPIQRLKTGLGWVNHPAVAMWRGFEPALYLYWGACIDTWVEQRKGNSKFYPLPVMIDFTLSIPPWLGDSSFHESHRSNLIRKYYEHVRKTTWDYSVDPYPDQWPHTPKGLPYVWPDPVIEDSSYVPSGLDDLAKYLNI